MADQSVLSTQAENCDAGTNRGEVPDLVPARMLNEFTYCPRLMYLEWVEGDFADNADTIEGRYRHRRVDQPSGQLDSGEVERVHARSVELSAPRVGLIARMEAAFSAASAPATNSLRRLSVRDNRT